MNRNNNPYQYTPPSTNRRTSTSNLNAHLLYYDSRTRQQSNNPYTYSPYVNMFDSRTRRISSQSPQIYEPAIHQQFPTYNASSLFDAENPELNHDLFTSPTFSTHHSPQVQLPTMHRRSYVPPVYSTPSTTNIFNEEHLLENNNNRFSLFDHETSSSHYTSIPFREVTKDSIASRMDAGNEMRLRLLNDIERSITDLDKELESLENNRSRYSTVNLRHTAPQPTRFSSIIELDILEDDTNRQTPILGKFTHSAVLSQSNNNQNKPSLSQPTSAKDNLSLTDSQLWPQKQKRAYEVIPRFTGEFKTSRQSSSTNNNMPVVIEAERRENQLVPVESSSSANNRNERIINDDNNDQQIENDLSILKKDSYKTDHSPIKENLISNEERPSGTQIYHYGPEIEEIEILVHHPENIDIYETNIESFNNNEGNDLELLTIDQFLRDRSSSPRSRVMLTAHMYGGGSATLENETEDILDEIYDVARSLINSPLTDLADVKDLYLENLEKLILIGTTEEPKHENHGISALVIEPSNNEILLNTPAKKDLKDDSLSISSAKTVDKIQNPSIKLLPPLVVPVDNVEQVHETKPVTPSNTIPVQQPYFFSDFGNDDEDIISLDTNNFINNPDLTGMDGGMGGQSDYFSSSSNNALILPQGEEVEERNNFSTIQQQFKRNNTTLNAHEEEKKETDENMRSSVTTAFKNNHYTADDDENILIANSKQDRTLKPQSATSYVKLETMVMEKDTQSYAQNLQQSMTDQDLTFTRSSSRPLSSRSCKESPNQEKQVFSRHTSSKSHHPRSQSSAIKSPLAHEKSLLDMRPSLTSQEKRNSAELNLVDSLKNESAQDIRLNSPATTRTSHVTNTNAKEASPSPLDERQRSRKNSSNVHSSLRQSEKRLSSSVQNSERLNSSTADRALKGDDLNTSSVSHTTPEPISKHASATSSRLKSRSRVDDDSQFTRQNSNVHENKNNFQNASPLERKYSHNSLMSENEQNNNQTIANLLKNIPLSHENNPSVERTQSTVSNSSLPVPRTIKEEEFELVNSANNSLAPSRNQSPTIINRRKYSIMSNSPGDSGDAATLPVNNTILLQTTTDENTTTTTVTIFAQQNRKSTIEQTVSIAPKHIQKEQIPLEIESEGKTSPLLSPTARKTKKKSNKSPHSTIRQNDEKNISTPSQRYTPSKTEHSHPPSTSSLNSLEDNLDVQPERLVKSTGSNSPLNKIRPLEIQSSPPSEKSISTSSDQVRQVSSLIRDDILLNSDILKSVQRQTKSSNDDEDEQTSLSSPQLEDNNQNYVFYSEKLTKPKLHSQSSNQYHDTPISSPTTDHDGNNSDTGSWDNNFQQHIVPPKKKLKIKKKSITKVKLKPKLIVEEKEKLTEESVQKEESTPQLFGRLWCLPDGTPTVFNESLQWNAQSKLKSYSFENIYYEPYRREFKIFNRTPRWNSESKLAEVTRDHVNITPRQHDPQLSLIQQEQLQQQRQQQQQAQTEKKIYDAQNGWHAEPKLKQIFYGNASYSLRPSDNIIFDEKPIWRAQPKLKTTTWDNIHYQPQQSKIQIYHKSVHWDSEAKIRTRSPSYPSRTQMRQVQIFDEKAHWDTEAKVQCWSEIDLKKQAHPKKLLFTMS
ncbi:unnamed protein product, partial [Didymodactylos carnosus]